jgi:hypothetical protein
MTSWRRWVAAARFPVAAYRFLRRPPLDPATAIAEVRRRLANRASSCLDLLERTVFRRPGSPYFRLLRASGCEAGDLRAAVARDGLEGALAALARAGVYLRVDEFKGRRQVVRGSERFWMHPGDLRNPSTRPALAVATGGSRGRPAGFGVGLDFVADHAVDTLATLHGHGGAAWRHATWNVPGAGSLINALEFGRLAASPARWFWQFGASDAGLEPRYRWSALLLAAAGWAAGRSLGAPQVVSLGDPSPIARWMRSVLDRGEVPHLWTYASAAVRVCRAASAAGFGLPGARFTAGGEPLTAIRRAAIEQSGAGVLPRYGATETDIIGFACAAPRSADDQHLLDDRRAVVQFGPSSDPLAPPESSLLFTSVLDSDPLILLNLSLGDCARLVDRTCGCPLEAIGWRRHLESIRSHEKLTAGGMTFLDQELEVILDGVLPQRFGGEPTDYQLVEADQAPELRLVVDPRIGLLDVEAVRQTFLAALGERGAARVMAAQWRTAGLPRVERRAPSRTPAGKLLHLHRQLGRGDSLP